MNTKLKEGTMLSVYNNFKSATRLAELEATHVKVTIRFPFSPGGRMNTETFWAKVHKYEGDVVHASITQDLIYADIHGLDDKMPLELPIGTVRDALLPDDKVVQA